MFRSHESPVRAGSSSGPSSSLFTTRAAEAHGEASAQRPLPPARAFLRSVVWSGLEGTPASGLLLTCSSASLLTGTHGNGGQRGSVAARTSGQRCLTASPHGPASACSAATGGSGRRCDPVSQMKKHQLCLPLASQVLPGSDLNPDPGVSVARRPSGAERGRRGRWPRRGGGKMAGSTGAGLGPAQPLWVLRGLEEGAWLVLPMVTGPAEARRQEGERGGLFGAVTQPTAPRPGRGLTGQRGYFTCR